MQCITLKKIVLHRHKRYGNIKNTEQMFDYVYKGMVITMDGREVTGCPVEMTNEEYREELKKIFAGINENYKLRWFYLFVSEKIRSSN